MPKPGDAGGATPGPPFSIQRNTRLCGCNSQISCTRPDSTDKAPYLAALVESSCIARAVIDLPRQQRLAFFRFLALGDVHGDAADADHMVGGIDACHGGADAPARLPAWAADPKLALQRRRVRRRRLDRILQVLPI